MADKQQKKQAPAEGEERFDPKPVRVGGDSIVERLLPHKTKIIVMIVLGFAVWGAIAVVMWIRDKKEIKQTARLAKVLDVADKPVHPPPPATGSGSAAALQTDAFPDDKARALAVLSTLAAEHTDKAGPAYQASMLVAAGKVDDAIALYRAGQTKPGLEGVLAREGLGLALETKAGQEKDEAARKKDLEDALAAFQAMQPDDKGPGHAYALYHQGRILVRLGRKDEAKAAFEKAKAAGKDPSLVQRVDERLVMLGA
ncbi:MAG: hypothetical protein ACM31C_10215 [Acidobacteriota bacterium]